jgi:type IV pilus assembly protein PilQ
MTSLFAILMSVLMPGSQITWLSVSPVSDRTEVVIRVQGPVTYKEPFMMDDGRLVVDITGVDNTTEVDQSVNRGGINRVRVKQFQPNVARVVFELAGPTEYKVVKEDELIRVQFPNKTGLFEAWSAAVHRPVADTRATDAAAVDGPGGEPAAAAPLKTVSTSTRSSARAQDPRQNPRSQEPLMTVTYRDRPLAEVLGDFSAISGRTILPAPATKDISITASILPPGLPWPVALGSILDANGLSQRVTESGVIIIEAGNAAAARVKDLPVVTVNIPLQNVDADTVAIAVRSALTPQTGQISVVKTSNSLLVTDVQSVIDRIQNIIKLVDQPAAQVDISATIAFIDRTTLEALGVVYDLKDSRGNQLSGLSDNFVDADGNGKFDPTEATTENVVLLGGNSIAALGNANVRVAGPALTLATSLVLGRHTLISFLEALQTVSLSDIQAKPSVRTSDNYLARIQVGERTPIRTVDAGSAGGLGAPRAQTRVENTGIILEVTPHVTGNQVQLRMHAERSNIGPTVGTEITFQTQQADNVVTVRDGETVVVGGLTIIEKTKSRTGIPFLMDLPVIGKLFRNDRDVENKRDLLILVSPHIVRDQ